MLTLTWNGLLGVHAGDLKFSQNFFGQTVIKTMFRNPVIPQTRINAPYVSFSSLLLATSLLLQRKGSRLLSFTHQIFPTTLLPMTPWKLVTRTKRFNQVCSLFPTLKIITLVFFSNVHFAEYFALAFLMCQISFSCRGLGQHS